MARSDTKKKREEEEAAQQAAAAAAAIDAADSEQDDDRLGLPNVEDAPSLLPPAEEDVEPLPPFEVRGAEPDPAAGTGLSIQEKQGVTPLSVEVALDTRDRKEEELKLHSEYKPATYQEAEKTYATQGQKVDREYARLLADIDKTLEGITDDRQRARWQRAKMDVMVRRAVSSAEWNEKTNSGLAMLRESNRAWQIQEAVLSGELEDMDTRLVAIRDDPFLEQQSRDRFTRAGLGDTETYKATLNTVWGDPNDAGDTLFDVLYADVQKHADIVRGDTTYEEFAAANPSFTDEVAAAQFRAIQSGGSIGLNFLQNYNDAYAAGMSAGSGDVVKTFLRNTEEDYKSKRDELRYPDPDADLSDAQIANNLAMAAQYDQMLAVIVQMRQNLNTRGAEAERLSIEAKVERDRQNNAAIKSNPRLAQLNRTSPGPMIPGMFTR